MFENDFQAGTSSVGTSFSVQRQWIGGVQEVFKNSAVLTQVFGQAKITYSVYIKGIPIYHFEPWGQRDNMRVQKIIGLGSRQTAEKPSQSRA